MEKFLKEIGSLIPLFLVVFYCLGYSKMIGYYSVFDIDIEYYLSLSDFIFVAVKGVIKVLVIYLIIDLVMTLMSVVVLYIFYWFIHKEPRNEAISNHRKQEFEEKLGQDAANGSGFLTMLFLVISIIFFRDFHGLLVFLGFTVLIQFLRVLFTKEDFNLKELTNLSYAALIILIIGFYGWGIVEGKYNSKKDLAFEREIRFTYEGEKFSSFNENQFFLGETTEYIFMYDPVKTSTKVIPKNSVKDFLIVQSLSSLYFGDLFWQ
jgi:hypothetical protein